MKFLKINTRIKMLLRENFVTLKLVFGTTIFENVAAWKNVKKSHWRIYSLYFCCRTLLSAIDKQQIRDGPIMVELERGRERWTKTTSGSLIIVILNHLNGVYCPPFDLSNVCGLLMDSTEDLSYFWVSALWFRNCSGL